MQGPAISNAKNYIRDQLRRASDRFIARTVRVALGWKEKRKRSAFVAKINRKDTIPTVNLENLGYSSVACDPQLTSEFIKLCQQRLEETKEFKQRGGKDFFSQLLKPEDYELDSPIMRFALDEKLLNTTALYIGTAPYLQSIELLYSRPVTGPAKSSQLWHRDRHDKDVLKVFVYCHDVGPKNGPFTFIPKSFGKNVPERLYHYISDETMRKYVDDAAIQVLEGPAGSTLLIDTYSCYHKGSYCIEPRLAAILYFDSGFGYRKRFGTWSIPPEKLKTLSPLQRYALGDVPE
ncbi:MAG: phytanoyl-CoA dioxygenase family protein [Chryseolinea sp.]